MKKIIIALFAAISAPLLVGAQEVNPCGTNEAQDLFYSLYPEIQKEHVRNELLRNSLEIKENANGTRAASYVVPVVFHVLHQYGAENISDQTIYSLIGNVNKDYSATNSNISEVGPLFDTIIGDAQIEFRLASMDPFGNCTNGIEHIYTHETMTGQTHLHKVGQWNRAHYLNIWIVEDPGAAGPGLILMGYASFPSSTDGSAFWVDGIVLNGIFAVNDSGTLTHEIGHYLGLCHSFGCNGTASDGLCDDDNVEDTPPADGTQSACNLAKDVCDTIPENVQNWMDYSSCRRMFTEGQVEVMHNVLNEIAGQRNNLWRDSTLMITGVDDAIMPQTALTVPVCTPVADFNANTFQVCLNEDVTFEDHSWNAVIDNRSWTFEDGSPATSSATNPTVSFTSHGWKQVTLTVSNTAGSDTRTETSYIYVSPDWSDYSGIASWDLEDNNNHWFLVNNYEDNFARFVATEGVGYNGSTAFKLNNYRDLSEFDPYTSESFYYNRLGYSVDELITPSVNLSNTSSIQVSFNYSYANNSTNVDDITESLRVYSSRDCGKSWIQRAVLTGTDLLTGGFAGGIDYAPVNNGMWAEKTFNYTSSNLDTKTRFKFVFEASDVSNNLFIDNINITGVVGIEPNEIAALDLELFPNPSNGEAINVSYVASDKPVTFTLKDMSGKTISSETVTTTNATVNHQLAGTDSLPSACYFVVVSTGDYSVTKKVVVL